MTPAAGKEAAAERAQCQEPRQDPATLLAGPLYLDPDQDQVWLPLRLQEAAPDTPVKLLHVYASAGPHHDG